VLIAGALIQLFLTSALPLFAVAFARPLRHDAISNDQPTVISSATKSIARDAIFGGFVWEFHP